MKAVLIIIMQMMLVVSAIAPGEPYQDEKLKRKILEKFLGTSPTDINAVEGAFYKSPDYDVPYFYFRWTLPALNKVDFCERNTLIFVGFVDSVVDGEPIIEASRKHETAYASAPLGKEENCDTKANWTTTDLANGNSLFGYGLGFANHLAENLSNGSFCEQNFLGDAGRCKVLIGKYACIKPDQLVHVGQGGPYNSRGDVDFKARGARLSLFFTVEDDPFRHEVVLNFIDDRVIVRDVIRREVIY